VAEVNRVDKPCPPADLCRKAKEAVMTDNPAVPEIPVRDNRGLFYGWFVVAAAFAVTFVGFGCTYSFSAFIESLQHDFGASRGSVSLVFALAGFLYFSVGSISGPLADRFGSRRLALIGMILIGAGLAAASVAESLLEVYAAYGLGIGLGVGCSYVPAVGAVPRWFARPPWLGLRHCFERHRLRHADRAALGIALDHGRWLARDLSHSRCARGDRRRRHGAPDRE
jgi:Major Facilitator Superfamily